MRSLLAFGMLITLCATASAATTGHHSRTHDRVFISPSPASSFAVVPGWIHYEDTPGYDDPSRFGGGALPTH
jgi:hypothetical protein